METEGSRVAAEVAPHSLGFRVPAYSDDAEILAYGLVDSVADALAGMTAG